VLAGVRHPERVEGRSYQQLEIETGPFRRVVSLNIEVDPEAAHAQFDNGLLTVELPVLMRAASVPIQTGEQ
jgi:HSP20 family protein